MTPDTMWAELQRRWHPLDTPPTNADIAYYQAKFRAVATIHAQRPVRSIVEIGVRAGYSAFAFLCAVPEAHYLGIDADRGEWGGQEGFFEYAQTTTLREFDNVEFMRTSSLDLHSLPEEYDFAHIDGDHSYTGAWHDLNLCASCSQVMMVDDYDMIFSVRAAVDHWLVQYTKTWAGAYYGDPNGRSSMLLMRRST